MSRCQRGLWYKKINFFSKVRVKLLNPQTEEDYSFLPFVCVDACMNLNIVYWWGYSSLPTGTCAVHVRTQGALATSSSIQMPLWGQGLLAIWTWYRYWLLGRKVGTINAIILSAFISEIHLSCLIIPVDIYIWKRHYVWWEARARQGTKFTKQFCVGPPILSCAVTLSCLVTLPSGTPDGLNKMVRRNQPESSEGEVFLTLLFHCIIARAYRTKENHFISSCACWTIDFL